MKETAKKNNKKTKKSNKRFTRSQVKKLKQYWRLAQLTESSYNNDIETLSIIMAKDLGIKELEFFINREGEMCGIGNQWANEKDKYKLIQQERLEK